MLKYILTALANKDLKAYALGCGIRPFWWRLCFKDFGGQTFLHVGPFFISWKLPFRAKGGVQT